jgi:hypothetical protein
MSFFDRTMRAGARLIFWLAMILIFVQLIAAAMAIKVMHQMPLQEQQFGPLASMISVISRLFGGFAWAFLLIALAMIIHRLDSAVGRGNPRK